jgi:predicted RND superfamily exporter protein
VFGTPLQSEVNAKPDEDMMPLDEDRKYPDDIDYASAYVKDVLAWVDEKYPASATKVNIRIDGIFMTVDKIMEVALEDTSKAFFSVVFVGMYLNFHMRSCFLASLGMGLIVLSFPFTAFICNAILQIKYFGFLQIMIIYIVLGIAADDIFVFYDAYQQSAEMDTRIMDSEEKRLAYAFRRSVRAMAITSSTTAVAFFANGLSELITIQTFGLFAGVIVPVNYLLVVMIFPPAVVWYEREILYNPKCANCICWGKCIKSKKETGE